MTAWTVRLTHQAERDVEAILAWTEDHFGTLQAEVYAEVLARAVEALLAGAVSPSTRPRVDDCQASSLERTRVARGDHQPARDGGSRDVAVCVADRKARGSSPCHQLAVGFRGVQVEG